MKVIVDTNVMDNRKSRGSTKPGVIMPAPASLAGSGNLTLLDKLSDSETRFWYAQKALELGMGKDMLLFLVPSRRVRTRANVHLAKMGFNL